MRFSSDEVGREASRKYYEEYDSRVEEWYSKDKRTATSPDEELEVKRYNECIRQLIEEKVMAEMQEEDFRETITAPQNSFLKRLKRLFQRK